MQPDRASLDFELPQECIALRPAERREDARLMVCHRGNDEITHTTFSEISQWLKAGDLLVLNDASVDRARIRWKRTTGGESEILLLSPRLEQGNTSQWEAIVSGKVTENQWHLISDEMSFRLIRRDGGGIAIIELSANIEAVRHWMSQVGLPPLPPYIRKARKRIGLDESQLEDVDRYQTVYAKSPGAVAAPTAGLHFSTPLINRLKSEGVGIAKITLRVGWGTFEPLREEHWKSGRLHPEHVCVSHETAQKILDAKRDGRRVIAVGTTVVRALEWWSCNGKSSDGIEGWCDLFLRPPWTPTIVDAMVTNFHLPHSSLLELVAGFFGDHGSERLRGLYTLAVQKGYRFYSYGDAMLID